MSNPVPAFPVEFVGFFDVSFGATKDAGELPPKRLLGEPLAPPPAVYAEAVPQPKVVGHVRAVMAFEEFGERLAVNHCTDMITNRIDVVKFLG